MPDGFARPLGDLDHLADAGPLAAVLGAVTAPLLRRRRLPPVAGLIAGLVVLAIGVVLARPVVTVLATITFVSLAAAAVRPPLEGRLAWLVPALLRAAEYAFVVRLAALLGGGVMPAAYALLAVVAYHHYDVVYRLRHAGSSAAPWVGVAALGFEGRMVVVLGLWLAGAGVAAPGCWVLAGWLAVIFGVESVTGWTRWLRTARPDVVA